MGGGQSGVSLQRDADGGEGKRAGGEISTETEKSG